MKKPLLYPKLAWQGIRKNAETYLPYLLMGILMVGVSYIMNYLTRPALMGALSMGGTTLMVLQMGKIVISVFSVIFLYYCNSFLIRRRMKEFGLYNILGMGKGNIARVMLWETLLTALLVFAGGLLLGLSLSRLVEMALINLLHADYTVPMELFYPDGVTWVLLLFGGIYVLILLANLWRMRLTNPVALLKSESVGEKPPKGNWFFALAGLVILLGAYYLAAVSQSPMEALMFFFVAVLMVIIATYLLFVSGSVTLCRMLRRSKRYYYQTRHFISVSAMAYRMKRNGAGMATICILCTMVLVILTSTVCLSAGTDSMVDAICPQDINLTIGLEARDGEENRERLDAMRQMALTVTEEMGLTPENITSQRALVATGKVQNGDYGIITDADSLKANVLELTVYPLSVYEQATGETVTLADRELLYASFKTNEAFSSMSFYGSAPYRMIHAEKELPKRMGLPGRFHQRCGSVPQRNNGAGRREERRGDDDGSSGAAFRLGFGDGHGHAGEISQDAPQPKLGGNEVDGKRILRHVFPECGYACALPQGQSFSLRRSLLPWHDSGPAVLHCGSADYVLQADLRGL